MSLANNNPGNLIDNAQGYVGQISSNDRFANFDTLVHGLRAWYMNYAHQVLHNPKMTLQEYITKYAPAGDGANDPGVYLDHVVLWSGLSGLDLLPHDPDQVDAILKAQIRQEIGEDRHAITDADYADARQLFAMSVQGFLSTLAIAVVSATGYRISYLKIFIVIFIIFVIIYRKTIKKWL